MIMLAAVSMMYLCICSFQAGNENLPTIRLLFIALDDFFVKNNRELFFSMTTKLIYRKVRSSNFSNKSLLLKIEMQFGA